MRITERNFKFPSLRRHLVTFDNKEFKILRNKAIDCLEDFAECEKRKNAAEEVKKLKS